MLIDKDDMLMLIDEARNNLPKMPPSMILDLLREAVTRRRPAVLFICDHRACERCTAETGQCCSTTKIEHAKNFEKLAEFYYEVEDKPKISQPEETITEKLRHIQI